MPNPKANQQPLDLDRIKADAMSMGIPARVLLDMIASGARSAVATTAGLPVDTLNTAIGLHNMAHDIRRRKFEGYEPGTIPGGSEDIKGLIPNPVKDPNSNLNKMADFGGDFAIIPGVGTAAMKGAKMVGQEIADRVATGQKLMPGLFSEPQMAMPLTAWHGSPYKFIEFDSCKIGTGEGAQAYGHGLYLAENPKVAKEYRNVLTGNHNLDQFNPTVNGEIIDTPVVKAIIRNGGNPEQFIKDMQPKLKALENKLSQANKDELLPGISDYDMAKMDLDRHQSMVNEASKYIGKNVKNEPLGNLYKVDLPDEHIEKMLDWDKSWKQQPKNVQDAINIDNLLKYYKTEDLPTSQVLYHANQNRSPKDFAKFLSDKGVPGIKYLDEQSRATGEGTRNFVIFPGNEHILDIQEINGNPINKYSKHSEDQISVVPKSIDPNPEEYAKGGIVKHKIHVDDDLDMMRHEVMIKDGVQRFQVGGLAKGMSKLFSAVDKTAIELQRAKGTGKEFMTELSKKPGVKKAELADRNLHEINELPKMTKDQFKAELDKRPVPKVSKKILSNDAEPLRIVKHNPDSIIDDRHWVVDRDNEPVTAHPFPSREDAESHIENHEIDENGTHHENFKLPGGQNYQEHLYKYEPEGQETFVANRNHFGGEPNVLASARTVDRKTPEGKKILHVEEIQSDWHQKGREKGYKDVDPEKGDHLDEQREQIKQKFDELNKHRWDLWGRAKREPDATPEFLRLMEEANSITPILEEMHSQVENIKKQILIQDQGVPNAPFKKNWEEMVSKDLIKHAIDNGYDGIALTNGKDQADRYSLAKHISGVDYIRNELKPQRNEMIAYDPKGNVILNELGMTPEKLEEHIGKEAAQKLLSQEPQPNQYGLPTHSLRGEQLVVGGEGMKGFYDKKMPNIFNDIGKPYSAEMKINDLPVLNNGKHYANRTIEGDSFNVMDGNDNIISNHPTQQEANIKARELNSTPLHYMEFTPEMKQGVATEGLPAYADGGQVAQPRHEAFLNPSIKLANGSVTINPLEFMPNYQKGGKVHVSDDMDMMRHELNRG